MIQDMKITDKHLNQLGEAIHARCETNADRQFLYDMISSCLVIVEVSSHYQNHFSNKFKGVENEGLPANAAEDDGK